MSKTSSAARARKKHEKANKRKQKLVRRDQKAAIADMNARLPWLKWRPALEGIVGLSHRCGGNLVTAAAIASGVIGDVPGIEATWHADRMQALSVDDLIEGLAALGITTDAESFAEQTATSRNSLTFAAETWLPLVADRPVEDRDFAQLAAAELWAVWRTDALDEARITDHVYQVMSSLVGDVSDLEKLEAFWASYEDPVMSLRADLHSFVMADMIHDTLLHPGAEDHRAVWVERLAQLDDDA